MMGRGKTYFISTYGCQANERDSETLAGILDELGFTPNETAEGSDVIIINTCAIRQNAEEKVLGEIGNFKRLYRENKDLIIGVCGCMAQEEGLVETLLTKYPQVRLLFGTHNIQELPSMLYSCMFEGKKGRKNLFERRRSLRKSTSTSFWNIQGLGQYYVWL